MHACGLIQINKAKVASEQQEYCAIMAAQPA